MYGLASPFTPARIQNREELSGFSLTVKWLVKGE